MVAAGFDRPGRLPNVPRIEGGEAAVPFMPQAEASLDDMVHWAIETISMFEPDFIIGPGSPDYIRRWWVIPRNPFSNIYLHYTQRDDDDRALHDHPWSSRSVILQGGYVEVTPEGAFERLPGEVIERAADAAHRIVLRRDSEGNAIPCISLFFTGPKQREWGFHCEKGWVHWRDFTGGAQGETVGQGCGE